MGRTKLDNRIRTLIENGVKSRHRSMFVLIGDKARDQIVILHHILAKATISSRPSVLWCYKKDLGFSSHRKKRANEIRKKIAAGVMHAREDDPFELFISSTDVRYCYYAESHKILGNTFGMLVLQDFEALTPNLLARTVETVEGGGLVVFLLQSVNSLRQLYTLTMDVHSRYRTEQHFDIVPRFNERFILSLASCPTCVVMDDRLEVLPISSHIASIEPLSSDQRNQKSKNEEELVALKEAMADTKPIGLLLKRCRTACQAKALLKLLDVITEKTLNVTCSITAARGRGKSAALGLAVGGAVGFGFTNIFVTSPTPENLRTLFEFVVKALEAMDYQEHADFEVIRSLEADQNKCVVRINVFREHRQIIQYIAPNEASKLGQAELVVIDEAAAIPMPLVKDLIAGNYLVFLASTINGYEGTGRSLSLKLLEQLRQQAAGGGDGPAKVKVKNSLRRALYEISLEESIRYNSGDKVEEWLNKLLCLDVVNIRHTITGTPSPSKCELYYVNRDTLFSFHKASETFLANMMSIYVSAHYKNTPNDLQMLSDAPAHHLFVLMAPVQAEQTSLPQILAVVQVCLEGALSRRNVQAAMERGKRVAGDMLAWTISQQFLDDDFPTLGGARIVRIAVHPDFQSMGYGSRAVQLLLQYYNGEVKFDSDSTKKTKGIIDVTDDRGDNDEDFDMEEDQHEGKEEYADEEEEMEDEDVEDDGLEDEEDDDEEDEDEEDENEEEDEKSDEKKAKMVNGSGKREKAFSTTHNRSTLKSTAKNSKEEEREEEEDEFQLHGEVVEPRSNLPPLLLRLGERRAESLDYVGVSFGLTLPLLKFWKRASFVPVYLRQTASELTGEHTCIVLRMMKKRKSVDDEAERDGTAEVQGDGDSWLMGYFREFRHRFVSLLSFSFAKFTAHLALSLMHLNVTGQLSSNVKRCLALSREHLAMIFSNTDLRRLADYARNMADQQLITDLLPTVASTYFNERVAITVDVRQAAVLMCVGLQRKSVDVVARELGLPASQTFALLNKAIRRLSEHFDQICKHSIEAQMSLDNKTRGRMDAMVDRMVPTLKSLEEDLRDAATEIRVCQDRDRKELQKELKDGRLTQFSVRGTEDDWMEAVDGDESRRMKRRQLPPTIGGIVSVKSDRVLAPDPKLLKELERAPPKNSESRKRKHRSKH